MSSPEEFVFVETASGGTDKRNWVRKLDEYRAPAHVADCFVSMLRFTEDLLNYSHINTGHRGRPSVAGYRGPALAEFMPLDFDCKKDPAKAVAEAAQLVSLSKPSLEVVEADHRATEVEKRLMDVVAPLITDREPAVLSKPGQ